MEYSLSTRGVYARYYGTCANDFMYIKGNNYCLSQEIQSNVYIVFTSNVFAIKNNVLESMQDLRKTESKYVNSSSTGVLYTMKSIQGPFLLLLQFYK